MSVLHYPIPNWLHDHHLGGRTILPAVESMQLMAAAYAGIHPAHKPNSVIQARFLRLVEIEAQETELKFFVELMQEQGREVLVLLRRLALKGMTRMLRCAELVFQTEEGRADLRLPAWPDAIEQTLPAELIYRKLVPFGPAFQTLRGDVWLSSAEAGGQVCAPGFEPEDDGHTWLGSSFPLDGAMHVACVHGQRLASFVPFPVALQRRRVYQATQPGGSYQVRVLLRQQEVDRLVYDLWLTSGAQVCEEVQGLVMRDVSGGTMRSPAWLHRISAGGANATVPLS